MFGGFIKTRHEKLIYSFEIGDIMEQKKKKDYH